MLKQINFQWNSRLNQLSIPARTLNKLLFTKWIDNFGWFQQTFNVFGFMKIKREAQIRSKNIRRTPLRLADA